MLAPASRNHQPHKPFHCPPLFMLKPSFLPHHAECVASARPAVLVSLLAACGACLAASDGEEIGGEQTWCADQKVSTRPDKWHGEKT